MLSTLVIACLLVRSAFGGADIFESGVLGYQWTKATLVHLQ